jgi:hypothetical protein
VPHSSAHVLSSPAHTSHSSVSLVAQSGSGSLQSSTQFAPPIPPS